MLRSTFYITLLFLLFASIYLSFSNRNLREKVLAERTVLLETPTTTISPLPTASPSPTPRPTTTPTPSPTPAVKKYSSQEINGFIDNYANQYGVSPHVMRHIATCESSFNPLAITGKYAGLFQFSAATWRAYRVKIGEDPNPDLRLNGEEAVQVAAYALSTGGISIWPNCKP